MELNEVHGKMFNVEEIFPRRKCMKTFHINAIIHSMTIFRKVLRLSASDYVFMSIVVNYRSFDT